MFSQKPFIMYDLPYNKEKDPSIIKKFIAGYPFAFLTGSDAAHKPVATQVPLFMDERNGRNFLSGHIMNNTDHHKAFLQNPDVLAVFTGHHTYVSGTWYSNPHTASTWNYMSVHVKGIIRFLNDKGLEDVLRKTTLHFENYNPQSTTIFDNLPAEFKQKVMKAIVAFEIEVTEIDNVFKLSQDRDHESYRHIMEKLRQQDENGRVIADEMEKRMEEQFPQ